MEKIIQINYQGRNISIQENAYNAFQQYEQELKAYFLKEEGGEETFSDLQYRMAEILDQRFTISGEPISIADINDLIALIGKPSDLDPLQGAGKDGGNEYSAAPKKKLYRNKNKNEKVIAGVCSGIANYFSIDPIAVRLAFVLFTIFNIATLFSFNVGILAYVLFWVLLEPAYLKTNIERKLFRNPKDKVLGGVCSGLAQFFSVETWIVRLIFLAPLVLGIMTDSAHFPMVKLYHVSSFFYSVSFISYILLWVIVPLAKSSTDYMLLKGEPINISTIQNSTSMDTISRTGSSGFSKFLKVIAYIFIAFLLMVLIPVSFSLVLVTVLSYKLAAIVLFTSFNKMMALFTLLFFIVLPVLGLIVWFIRRIAGYKKPNKVLRLTFTGLNILGWAAAIMLVSNVVRDNTTYVSKPKRIEIPVTADTLHVDAAVDEAVSAHNVVFEMNQFDQILQRTADLNNLKAVRIKYKQTDEPNFYMEIERSAFGSSRSDAENNADNAIFEPRMDSTTLYLPSMVGVSNKEPYHFQNVKVTIYVPKNRTLVVTEKYRRQLQYTIRTNHQNFHYNMKSSNEVNDDEIVKFDADGDEIEVHGAGGTIIRIDGNNDVDSKEEATRKFEDAQREAQRKIEDAQRALDESNREAQRNMEESKREAERQIEEAKRQLEDAKREASQQLKK